MPDWIPTRRGVIDYPAGDERLRPPVRQVYDWLFSRHFLEPPMTVSYSGQEDRVRHCASMDGNAIWYCVRLGLGLEEDRTHEAVDRLIRWQWPDGGWNCDRRRGARRSSFQESLIPARGLWAYGRAPDHAQVMADLGRPSDPRCSDALELLESKRVPGAASHSRRRTP